MDEAKTVTPIELVNNVGNEQRRRDALELLALMEDVTGHEPVVWSGSTVGFGQYHYRYKTGQEGDFFSVGFSPRADRITLYIMSGLRGFDDILDRLGPHTSGKSTVHIKRLDDLDREALIDLISECVKHVEQVEKAMGAIPRMSDIPPRKAH
ncbi:MAG: DUF1801 domain-containing protein [Acidimicrobiia bacterium]|nr:DUF1801 domain-containing protein [Acidimicrobiia bacterium]MBT8250732.1 DUF1801 domain-containing protein [Acidimicrobiia bacterium]NNL28896.1 DUF1801 domain-containing protein [Acidimicrobiia bacterium]NNL47845.1 DUF1801 domain-containing protein [Acidimicrobiia bacterium]